MGELLPRVTRFTITSLEALAEQLAQVRRRGYAICEQEAMIGICGLAVSVRGRAGAALASLALGITSHMLPGEQTQRWLPLLRPAADTVSQLLYNGRPPD